VACETIRAFILRSLSKYNKKLLLRFLSSCTRFLEHCLK